jgi:hypothetical protein
MAISDHVKGQTRFDFYREGNLYYKTDTGLQFPVPLSDTQGATFLAEDKSIFFMRWIRKHLDAVNQPEPERGDQ